MATPRLFTFAPDIFKAVFKRLKKEFVNEEGSVHPLAAIILEAEENPEAQGNVVAFLTNLKLAISVSTL